MTGFARRSRSPQPAEGTDYVSDITNMLRFHPEGLQRFSKVIDGNPNYDVLLKDRLRDRDLAFFDGRLDIAEKRRHAYALFESKINQTPYRAIQPRFAGLACEGETRNNLREFSFFERICPDVKSKLSANNYSSCARVNHSKLGDAHRVALKTIQSDVEAFYEARSTISASLVHQQILYSRSFLGFLIAFSSPGAIKPTALIQANDHSPVRVALSMVMKGMGIPRVYLQHAEVSRHFPELDFEFSVLRNEYSRQIYSAIAQPKGKIYVIPRERGDFARDRLATPRGKGINVVIYPTSRVDLNGLRHVLSELKSNNAVTKVFIKQHPASLVNLNEVVSTYAPTLIDSIPAQDHVALVGNSSVVIELLHQGIPVYQNFDFDPVQPDYYGFVRRGLTIPVAHAELSTIFWRPYELNDTWREAYAHWNPPGNTADLDQQTAFAQEMARLAQEAGAIPMHRRFLSSLPRPGADMRVRVKRHLKRILVGVVNAHPELFSRSIDFIVTNTDLKVKDAARDAGAVTLLERTLCELEKPAEWLMLNDKLHAFRPIEVVTALEALFQQRSPALKKVFEGFRTWPPGSAVGTWIYLKKADLANIEIDPDEFEAIARFVYGQDGWGLEAHLQRSLLTAILRSGTVEQLDQFWHNSRRVRKDNLSISHQIGVLRKLAHAAGREAELASTRAEFERNASRLHLLKFKNMDAFDRKPAPDWSHRYAEKAFSSSAPRRLAQEFGEHVQPTYDLLRTRMRFMGTRTNPYEAQAFLALIRAALENRTPFSFIRLSDGEGYLFPEGKFFDDKDARNRERHWWGVELSDDMRTRIVQNARHALSEADVVGIPSVYRFIRDHSDRSTSLTQTIQGRGLLQVLGGVFEAVSPATVIAEDKINVSVFSDIAPLLALAKAARKVIVVGSVHVDHLPQALLKAQKVETLVIPTHHRTSLNDRYHAGAAPLPTVYGELLDKLDAMSGPGDLVLVAGGVIGKTFVGRARQAGAVALDIGSVLDDWGHRGLLPMR